MQWKWADYSTPSKVEQLHWLLTSHLPNRVCPSDARPPKPAGAPSLATSLDNHFIFIQFTLAPPGGLDYLIDSLRFTELCPLSILPSILF